MKKKSIGGKSVKRKTKKADKAASKMRIGDHLFEKNRGNIFKEREDIMEDTALKAVPEAMTEAVRQLRKMGIEVPADSGVGVGIGVGMTALSMLSEQLGILTAEMRTIRQLLEVGIVARAVGRGDEAEAILRRLEEKLR